MHAQPPVPRLVTVHAWRGMLAACLKTAIRNLLAILKTLATDRLHHVCKTAAKQDGGAASEVCMQQSLATGHRCIPLLEQIWLRDALSASLQGQRDGGGGGGGVR
jgi:hypothetical protein